MLLDFTICWKLVENLNRPTSFLLPPAPFMGIKKMVPLRKWNRLMNRYLFMQRRKKRMKLWREPTATFTDFRLQECEFLQPMDLTEDLTCPIFYLPTTILLVNRLLFLMTAK